MLHSILIQIVIITKPSPKKINCSLMIPISLYVVRVFSFTVSMYVILSNSVLLYIVEPGEATAATLSCTIQLSLQLVILVPNSHCMSETAFNTVLSTNFPAWKFTLSAFSDIKWLFGTRVTD